MIMIILRRPNKKGLSHGTHTGTMLNKQTSAVNEYHLRDSHV